MYARDPCSYVANNITHCKVMTSTCCQCLVGPGHEWHSCGKVRIDSGGHMKTLMCTPSRTGHHMVVVYTLWMCCLLP